MLICGITIPVYNTPAMTLIQTEVPPALMGRVFSVVMVVNGLALTNLLYLPIEEANVYSALLKQQKSMFSSFR